MTSDDTLWLGTEHGLSHFDGEQFTNFTAENILNPDTVLSLYLAPDGVLWIGTSKSPNSGGSGLWRYADGRFVNFTAHDGFLNNRVMDVYRAQDGVLWVGTQDGLFRYDEKLFSLTTQDGLVANNIRKIQKDAKGDMWVCTDIGVSRYDLPRSPLAKEGSKGGFVNFTQKDGLVNGDVLTCECDADGRMWFGTSGGLSQFDGKAFRNFTQKDGLIGDEILSICAGATGEVWIGTWDGVSQYDGENFTNLTTREGLSENSVQVIHRAVDGRMWFGTSKHGVCCYDGSGFSHFHKELPDGSIRSIFQDADGGLWVGVWGEVCVYDGERFRALSHNGELGSYYVRDIYRTADGIMWFATDGGVFLYDGIAWSTLTFWDGLSRQVRSIVQTGAKGLWFGTEDGLTYYHRSETKPGVRIIAVTTDQRYTDLDAIEPAIVGTRITFEFRAIDFKTHPTKRQYRYKLSGYDSDWSPPTRTTQVDYADLAVGRYTFHVQAIDRDLNYSQPATMKIDIQPNPQIAALQNRLIQLSGEVGRKYRFENIIGGSIAIKHVLAQMEKAIDSDLTVLITGETGTGKELVAKGIHFNSPRKDRPLLARNCGALPRDLLISELFGHRKGAFTGAFDDKEGLFEAAQGGTVLLDEIGEMPEDAQIHLLRVLQERKIQRLGEFTSRDVDMRIIAITNRNLAADVKSRRFREDLYYRLNLLQIHVPPLRERTGDIPPLVAHFLKRACQQMNREIDRFAPDVMDMLKTHHWSGNIRELENEIFRAVAQAEEYEPLQVRHFSPELTDAEVVVQEIASEQVGLSNAIERLQRRMVEDALRESNGNRTQAAKILGLHRPSLVRLMKRLGVETPKS